MCEMVPEDPLNAAVNMIHVPKNAVPGTIKYNVTEVQAKKLFLLKYCKMESLCTSALCVRKSWYLGGGGIDTHIRVEHFNKAYSCPHFKKVCKSLDGFVI